MNWMGRRRRRRSGAQREEREAGSAFQRAININDTLITGQVIVIGRRWINCGGEALLWTGRGEQDRGGKGAEGEGGQVFRTTILQSSMILQTHQMMSIGGHGVQ